MSMTLRGVAALCRQGSKRSIVDTTRVVCVMQTRQIASRSFVRSFRSFSARALTTSSVAYSEAEPISKDPLAQKIRPIRLKYQEAAIPPMGLTDALVELRKNVKRNETIELNVLTSTHDKTKKKGRPRDTFRGIAVVPHSFKVSKRVVVLSNENPDVLGIAGAAAIGDVNIVPQIVDGTLAFDVLLATPDIVGELKRFGRGLGRNMPSLKRGTVAEDMQKLVKEYIDGLPFKSSDRGGINIGVGKLELTDQQIFENIETVLNEINSNRLTTKGKFILELTISRTQGPSFPLSLLQFEEI
eukprot:m.16585 g.16585  ORF g.16585 m.16585 type:complete len:299 (+) comp11116_c0_seq1:199-1095(+)